LDRNLAEESGRLEQIQFLKQGRMTSGATKIDGLHLGSIISCCDNQSVRYHLSCTCAISIQNSNKTENSEVVACVACWRLLHSPRAVKFSQAHDVDMHFGMFITNVINKNIYSHCSY